MVAAVSIGCTLHVMVEDRVVVVRQVHVMVDPLVMDQNHIHLDCHDIHYLEHHNYSLVVVVVDRMFEHEVAPFEQLMYQKLLLLLLSLVVELVEQLVSNFLLCQIVE